MLINRPEIQREIRQAAGEVTTQFLRVLFNDVRTALEVQ